LPTPCQEGTTISESSIEEGQKGVVTAIAHNHDFGIDTMLVPGPPIRIHARIGGHRSGSRGKEGTRKSSAGMIRGRGKGEERRKRGERDAGR
jgi:hypothetical protein